MERRCIQFQYTQPVTTMDTSGRGGGWPVMNPANGNIKSSSNCSDFIKCSMEVPCPEKVPCFGFWNRSDPTYPTYPTAAGCSVGMNMTTHCAHDCQTVFKGQNLFCCCTGHLCNMKIGPPLEPYNPTSNAINGTITNIKLVPTTSKLWYIIPTLFLCLVLFGVFRYRKRKAIQKRYNQANRGLQANANGNHSQTKRNYLNDKELTELKNNNDISLLVPFRNHNGNDGHAYFNNNNNNHLQPNTTMTNHHDAMKISNGIEHQQHSLKYQHQHQLQLQQQQQIQQQQQQLQLTNKIDLSRIKLLEVIGRGRFGTVHRAALVAPAVDGSGDGGGGDGGGEEKEVAVKIIASSDHQSWLNERQIYVSPKVRHQNILNFFGSNENLDTNSYWLVVEFASRGSLHSFLKDNLVNWDEFLHIALGIVHGLSHLHEADVAHRDFKSKNVLLKHDLTPCITDFGVAAILDTATGSQLDQRKKYLQVGTPRYMAPEVLECSVTFTKTSFTKIDVYALSLVFWELISRCRSLPKQNQYNSSASNYPSNSYLLETVSTNNPYYHSHHLIHNKQPLYNQQPATRNVGTPPPPSRPTSPQPTLNSGDGGVAKKPAGEMAATTSDNLTIDVTTNGKSEPSNEEEQKGRNEKEEEFPPYKLPFEDVAGQNPDINMMRQIVVVDKLRPPISDHWRLYPASEFCRAIEDGWEYDHDARISASCFVERVESLPKSLEPSEGGNPNN